MKRLYPALRPLASFSLGYLFSIFCFRILFSIQHVGRIRDAEQLIQILINGARIDLSLLPLILALPLGLILLTVWIPKLWPPAFEGVTVDASRLRDFRCWELAIDPSMRYQVAFRADTGAPATKRGL